MNKVRLGDICIKQSSKYAQKDLNELEGDYPVYGASGLIKRINVYHQDKDYVAVVKDGAGIGRTMYLPAKSSVIGTLQYLIPKENVEPKYLYYAVMSRHLEKYYTGATIPHIYFKDYKNEPILLQEKEEQTKIVSILDKVEKIIEDRKQELECLDVLIKARFVEMFGDTEHNTNSFPVEKLGNLCNVGSSKRIYQSEQSSKGVPFFRISDFSSLIETGMGASNLYISDEKYAELCEQGLVPSAGDVLITSRGTLGKCYIIKKTDRFYFQDGMISWLSNISEKITSLYLSYLFLSSGVQKQIVNLQAGSTVAYLSITMLKKLDIMIPPLGLQKQFAIFVAQVDKSKVVFG